MNDMKVMKDIYLVYAHESGDEPFLAGIYEDKNMAKARTDYFEMNGMRSYIVEEEMQTCGVVVTS